MKTPEDEAFDELARKQGMWGGGFTAKRQAAMDKINSEFHEEYIKYRTAFPKEYTAPQPAQEQWNEDEWRRNNWRCGHGWLRGEQCEICNAAQEPYDQTALELCNVCGWKTLIPDDGCLNCERAQPAQEPVAHPVIAGALYDFMGWLTSRKERIVLSSADNASPAADAIRDFANMRGLSLDDAKVLDWNTTPPQRPWVGLTAEDFSAIKFPAEMRFPAEFRAGARWAEVKLKDKNT